MHIRFTLMRNAEDLEPCRDGAHQDNQEFDHRVSDLSEGPSEQDHNSCMKHGGIKMTLDELMKSKPEWRSASGQVAGH